MELTACGKDKRLTMRLPTQVSDRRWQSVLLLVLVVLVEVAWGAALVFLTLRLV
jgi:hypothetical protein